MTEDVPPSVDTELLLSTDERKQAWAMIENVVTPSWISSVPKNIGTPGSGKVKADQWRTLGTVHFPMSLVVVWRETSQQKKQLLDITLSLVSAILIACTHSTSAAHANAYLQYMQNYISGIKELFPKFKFLPNHHMALHLHEYLVQYGPVHSWWTFPFERLIGIVQRIPSNGKPGASFFLEGRLII